ncbi:hypothetical protein CONPUDRAFT_168382 [Coniophora puteana RWD-64-598 SS2]|uniref:Uncharacterized protein n=1 Tax=Coniophora puteana (strain RWD-64-598) TaxID=741705 RepID=A0A5M3MFS5_CONPW|nr:uncharacterized protein CONPUDRAFT_168382 [Coniophora puteana RWD-64-598 SS2]EIW77465.1 hypothetical protein CONPUDRAFT_168382 [Coniophora puteana RWD-64-598 SS2]
MFVDILDDALALRPRENALYHQGAFENSSLYDLAAGNLSQVVTHIDFLEGALGDAAIPNIIFAFDQSDLGYLGRRALGELWTLRCAEIQAF